MAIRIDGLVAPSAIKPRTATTTTTKTPTYTDLRLQKDALVTDTQTKQGGTGYTPGGYTYPSITQPPATATPPVTAVTQPPVTPPVVDPPQPPPVTEPPGPGAPVAPGGAGAQELLGFTEDEISAALAAIEAEFGLTRDQLMADQTMIGAQYRLLMGQLERSRVQAIDATTADSVRRGVFRSGIQGQGVAQVEAQTLEASGQALAQRQAQEQAIQDQLRTLDSQKANEQARTEAELRRQYASTVLAARGL